MSRISLLENNDHLLCRLCLQSCDRPVNIFNPNGTNGLLLWEIIKELLQLDVCAEDGLPKTICRDCLKKVGDFKYFKAMCIKSRIEFLKLMALSGLVDGVPPLSFPEFPELSSLEPPRIKSEPVNSPEKPTTEDLAAPGGTPEAGSVVRHPRAERPSDQGEKTEVAAAPGERSAKPSPEAPTRSVQCQKRASSAEVDGELEESGTGDDAGNLRDLRRPRTVKHSDGSGGAAKETQVVEGYSLPRNLMFECPYCDRLVETRRGLTSHIKHRHLREYAHAGVPETMDAVDCTAHVPRSAEKTESRVAPMMGDAVGGKRGVGDSKRVRFNPETDPESSRWGLKECRVVLSDIFPNGRVDVPRFLRKHVFSKAPKPKEDGGQEHRTRPDSDEERAEADPLCRTGSGAEKDSTGEIPGKSSEFSRKKLSEAPEKKISRWKPGMQKFKGSEAMAQDPVPASRIAGKQGERSLPDSTRDDRLLNSYNRLISSNRERIIRTPGDQTERLANAGGEGIVPLNDVSEDGSRNDQLRPTSGCSRTEVWPHLILKLKHEIERVSDDSDMDDERSSEEEEEISSGESVKEIAFKSVPKAEIRSPSRTSPTPSVGFGEPAENGASASENSVHSALQACPDGVENFLCITCGFSCDTRELLDDHIRTHPAISQLYSCDSCGKRCTSKTRLQSHINASHSTSHGYPCRTCKRMYPNKLLLSQHEWNHHGRKRFACKQCDKAFYSKHQLLKHGRVHVVAPMPSDEEGQRLRNDIAIRLGNLTAAEGSVRSWHIPSGGEPVREELSAAPGEQPMPQFEPQWDRSAENMGAGFDSGGGGGGAPTGGQGYQGMLTEYEDSCLGHFMGGGHSQQVRKAHRCATCNREYLCASSLKKHMRRDHGIEYKCSWCMMMFISAEGLAKHIRSHPWRSGSSLQDGFRCPVCHKAYKDEQKVRGHLKYHRKQGWRLVIEGREGVWRNQVTEAEGLGWFKCTVCDNQYKSMERLAEHKRVQHMAFNLYECVKCKRRYRQLHSLRKHMRSCGVVPEKRPGETQAAQGEWFWPCHHCQRRFKDEASLQEHMTVHTVGTETSCLLCGASFPSSLLLWHHSKECHSAEQDEQCGVIDPGT